MSNILLIDFGSTYTKLTAVDTEKEEIIATIDNLCLSIQTLLPFEVPIMDEIMQKAKING